MPSPTETEIIKQEHEILKTLKEQFLSQHGRTITDITTVTNEELTDAKLSLANLKYRRDLLNQKLWPFEEELTQQKLKEQYDSQKDILQKVGLITTLSPSTIGISHHESIDRNAYPFPSLQEITKTMIKNKELLSLKMNQGFTTLLIVPLALSLTAFKDHISELLRKHHTQGKLLGTKTPRSTTDFIPLDLDTKEPLYIWDNILTGKQSGDLIYYPQQFDTDNHQGLTKHQLIQTLNESPFPGYEVLLVENTLYLPKEGEGITKGKDKDHIRKQLENNNTPINYLHTITDPSPTSPYRGERGLIAEAFLTQFTLNLVTTEHVSYDYDDQNGVWFIGNYVSGHVLDGFLGRHYRKVNVAWHNPGHRHGGLGCLSAVRVCALE